jgi:hypothetical protein
MLVWHLMHRREVADNGDSATGLHSVWRSELLGRRLLSYYHHVRDAISTRLL